MPRKPFHWLTLAVTGSMLVACGRQVPSVPATVPAPVAPTAPQAAPVFELPSMMLGADPKAPVSAPLPSFGGPVATEPVADAERPEGAPSDNADFSALSGIVAGQVVLRIREGAHLGRGIQAVGVRKISSLSLGDTFQT
ncbi:MAG: hypothetical protein EBU81_05745, partial [Proteobacteria bacterium]|nr:hypothetical protein [Pseudomonadota bacterium]